MFLQYKPSRGLCFLMMEMYTTAEKVGAKESRKHVKGGRAEPRHLQTIHHLPLPCLSPACNFLVAILSQHSRFLSY